MVYTLLLYYSVLIVHRCCIVENNNPFEMHVTLNKNKTVESFKSLISTLVLFTNFVLMGVYSLKFLCQAIFYSHELLLSSQFQEWSSDKECMGGSSHY